MVNELFRDNRPTADSRVLDPGCGDGTFIRGILRWCERESIHPPNIVGVELDGSRAGAARHSFRNTPSVRILETDFLSASFAGFDYVIGNPPYVAITSLDLAERTLYRKTFAGASGRFDLYLLFFEHALNALNPEGRIVFITPEKFLYVETAKPLRRLLASFEIEHLHFADENLFEGLVTYPLISSIRRCRNSGRTTVTFRDGTSRNVTVPRAGDSWLPAIAARNLEPLGPTLKDVASRISCGVATGADSVFVHRKETLGSDLLPFARPTISGRQIVAGCNAEASDVLLLPYHTDGTLMLEGDLGSLGRYLATETNYKKLIARTCTARKPWYAFHETPLISQICKPKILCKDIGPDPFFVLDTLGDIVPRHSVYYIIPSDPGALQELHEYLNSEFAKQWLRDHCQRASKGFVRLQSHILKELPVPEHLSLGTGDLFVAKKTA